MSLLPRVLAVAVVKLRKRQAPPRSPRSDSRRVLRSGKRSVGIDDDDASTNRRSRAYTRVVGPRLSKGFGDAAAHSAVHRRVLVNKRRSWTLIFTRLAFQLEWKLDVPR